MVLPPVNDQLASRLMARCDGEFGSVEYAYNIVSGPPGRVRVSYSMVRSAVVAADAAMPSRKKPLSRHRSIATERNAVCSKENYDQKDACASATAQDRGTSCLAGGLRTIKLRAVPIHRHI